MNLDPNYPDRPTDPDSPGSPAMPNHPADVPRGSGHTIPVPGPMPGPAPIENRRPSDPYSDIVPPSDPYSETGVPMDDLRQTPEELEAVEEPEEHSDAWITLKVKGALAVHREVSALSTEVTTDHGVVTLSGSASSEHERQEATSVAQGIKGVKRVENRMQVFVARP